MGLGRLDGERRSCPWSSAGLSLPLRGHWADVMGSGCSRRGWPPEIVRAPSLGVCKHKGRSPAMGKAGLVRLGIFLVGRPWTGRAEGRPEAAPGLRELAGEGRQVAWEHGEG